MIARLNTAEVAAATRRHPVTVRKALEAAELHGTQSGKGGRWIVREDCADAWADGQKCSHQTDNVTDIDSRRTA